MGESKCSCGCGGKEASGRSYQVPADGEMTLDELPVGATATIVKVLSEARGRKKFADVGLVPGQELLMEAHAPFGGLIRVKVMEKTGLHVHELLEAIVKGVPAPNGDPNAPLKALIFDSYYDPYRGVIVLVRIKDGQVKIGDKIRLMQAGKEYQVIELGIRTPKEIKTDTLTVGQVGYIAAQIKDIKDVRPGDTVTLADEPAKEALPGYRIMNPMVYCGLYPVDSDDYQDLKDALEKLTLNDASLQFVAETSQALGFGFRCGFLGLLHMDVVQERLDREYDLDLILTAPSVI